MTTTEQLDEDELATDPLEAGAEPADRPRELDRIGTPREERAGESMDERLAQEEPDVGS